MILHIYWNFAFGPKSVLIHLHVLSRSRFISNYCWIKLSLRLYKARPCPRPLASLKCTHYTSHNNYSSLLHFNQVCILRHRDFTSTSHSIIFKSSKTRIDISFDSFQELKDTCWTHSIQNAFEYKFSKRINLDPQSNGRWKNVRFKSLLMNAQDGIAIFSHQKYCMRFILRKLWRSILSIWLRGLVVVANDNSSYLCVLYC